MTENELLGFYWGAAIGMDLESDEVDQILAATGLDPKTASLKEAHAALRAYDPLRHAYAVESIRQKVKGENHDT